MPKPSLTTAGACRVSELGIITWQDFEDADLRAGTLMLVDEFPEAHKPAYKVTVDVGPELSVLPSAQVTVGYTKDELVGRQVVGAINFPPKQIGPFMSQVLIVGFDGEGETVILAVPDKWIPSETKLA